MTGNQAVWVVFLVALIAGALAVGGWVLLVWLAKAVWFA